MVAINIEPLNRLYGRVAKRVIRGNLSGVCFVLSLILAVPSACLAAGPFGFNYGETKDQVIREVGASHLLNYEPYSVVFDTAPRPHPDFEGYVLFFSPTQGLLKIVAYGRDVTTNDSGDQLRQTYSRIKEGIRARYLSPSAESDALTPRSLWTGADNWMTSVRTRDRNVSATWRPDPAKHDHLQLVELRLSASKDDLGYLVLVYEYKGWSTRQDELERARSDVF
jgi:hypothetical protein